VVGSGEEYLRCRSLLTVCQRRLGLSEAEDTRLEKYSFLEDINKPTTVELCISPVYRRPTPPAFGAPVGGDPGRI